MTQPAAIPVLFHGRTVGYLPPVRVPDDLDWFFYPISRIDQPPTEDIPTVRPISDVVSFRIQDRDAHGTPLELHVASLNGLLRIRTFIPEDHALADLTQHR